MKLTDDDLDKILKRPGYRVRGQGSTPAQEKGNPVDVGRGTNPRERTTGRNGGPAPAVRSDSKLEIRFTQQLAVEGLPAYVRNYLFLPDRDLELDFAWPKLKVGVEIQGGAHAIKANLARDCEKLSLGLLAGWSILPLDAKLVKSGRGLELLLELLTRKTP